MPGRFRGKIALITWSQVGDNLTCEDVKDHFDKLDARITAAVENHKDEGKHIHAYVTWDVNQNLAGTEWADVKGFHPNIKPVGRTPRKAYDYVKKDGDVRVDDAFEPPQTGRGFNRNAKATRKELFLELMAIDDEDEFWVFAKAEMPEMYVMNRPRLKALWLEKFRQTRASKKFELPEDAVCVPHRYPAVTEFLKQFYDDSIRGKCDTAFFLS